MLRKEERGEGGEEEVEEQLMDGAGKGARREDIADVYETPLSGAAEVVLCTRGA